MTIYYIKLTLQVKWRYHYPPKFISWVGQRNWDFSIVLASPVYFCPANESIFELTIHYIKLTLQVKWRYHYPPRFVFWVGQKNWYFSIVLASPVYFYPASEFIFELTIYYIKLTLQVKWRYHYPPKCVSWVGQRNWDFSIVLASPVYFYPACEFIFELTIHYIKLTLQVKWRYHYPPKLVFELDKKIETSAFF